MIELHVAFAFDKTAAFSSSAFLVCSSRPLPDVASPALVFVLFLRSSPLCLPRAASGSLLTLSPSGSVRARRGGACLCFRAPRAPSASCRRCMSSNRAVRSTARSSQSWPRACFRRAWAMSACRSHRANCASRYSGSQCSVDDGTVDLLPRADEDAIFKVVLFGCCRCCGALWVDAAFRAALFKS